MRPSWLAGTVLALTLGLPGLSWAQAPGTPEWWMKNDKFFVVTRYKEVWVNCPGRSMNLDPPVVVKEANFFYQNPKKTEHVLTTCKKFESKFPKRSWPPSEATAKPQTPPRFFVRRCNADKSKCAYVQER